MFHHSAHKAKILKGNFTVLFFPHSFLASLRSKKKDSNCDLIAVVIPSCNFQSATHIGTRTIRRESSIFSLIRLMGRSRHLVSMSCCFNLFLWLPLCSVSETTCESFVIRLWGQLIHLPRVWRCTYMTANTGAIVIYRFFFLRKSNIFGQEWGMFGFSVPFHPKYFLHFSRPWHVISWPLDLWVFSRKFTPRDFYVRSFPQNGRHERFRMCKGPAQKILAQF